MAAPDRAWARRAHARLSGAARAAALAGCGPTSSKSSSSAVTVSGSGLTIYLSEPPGLAQDPNLQDVLYAEQLAYHDDSGSVKDFHLRLLPLNGATLSDNARTAIKDGSAIAYLGELVPGTSQDTVGITNAEDLLQLSATDTATLVDTAFESLSTYGRTFVRVAPDNADQARALVAEAKALGVTSMYAADDGSGYGRSTADAVRSAARAAGLSVATSEAGAAGVFYGSNDPARAATFFASALSASPKAKLFGPSGLDSPSLASAVAGKTSQLYVTVPGTLPSAEDAAQKAFAASFAADFRHTPSVQAYLGYAAMSALLRAIVKAGAGASNRSTVLTDLRKQDFGAGGFVITRLQNGSLVPWRTAPTT